MQQAIKKQLRFYRYWATVYNIRLQVKFCQKKRKKNKNMKINKKRERTIRSQVIIYVSSYENGYLLYSSIWIDINWSIRTNSPDSLFRSLFYSWVMIDVDIQNRKLCIRMMSHRTATPKSLNRCETKRIEKKEKPSTAKANLIISIFPDFTALYFLRIAHYWYSCTCLRLVFLRFHFNDFALRYLAQFKNDTWHCFCCFLLPTLVTSHFIC